MVYSVCILVYSVCIKGSRKNNFPCLGAETPVWQGARTAHTPRMERTSNAARQDGSTPKQGKLFLREPLVREHGKRARTPLAAFFNIPLLQNTWL